MNRMLVLLMTFSAFSCSSSYEEETDRGYLLSFATEDITSLTWEMTASRPLDDGEETLRIDAAGSGAAALASDISDLMLVLIPPGTSGSIAEPAPGWISISVPASKFDWESSVSEFDETYPLDEAFVTYTDESGIHREVSGSIFVSWLSIDPDDSTADPEGGWRDGGDFLLNAELVDATFTLDDGAVWNLDGSVRVTGTTPGTPIDSGGDGDGDGDGDTGGDCSAYAGPEADAQRDVQCQAAWSAQCNGEDKSAYCDLYNSSSWGSAGNCPYC